MDQLARVFGLGLLGSLAARLPPRIGTAVQLVLVVVGTLLPLLPLLQGWIGLQDLLAYSALWLALSVATTLVRMRTLEPRTPDTQFFALHYAIMIGVLSVVCGVWSAILLAIAGTDGGWIALVPTGLALLLSNAWSLADGWFLRGGRRLARPWQVLLPGYLRFIPVLLGTVAGSILILSDGSGDAQLVVAVTLVLALATIDLTLALASRWLVSRGTDPAPDATGQLPDSHDDPE